MPEPVKFQFAFQGGGAKLVALLAAAEVIQDFERRRLITVSRTAGASAGAIVAALVAAGISCEAFLAELRGGMGERLTRPYVMPGWAGIYYKLLHKKNPIWNIFPLRLWLDEVFRKHGFHRIEDIAKRVPLTIAKTDLGSRASAPALNHETITDALVDSCAVPYLFKVWRDEVNATLVDGGISNNLPVKFLSGSDPSQGDMLAVCFTEKSTAHPSNIKEFSLSLLETAMASTMSLTKETFRGKLLEIHTSIDTFNFIDALSPNFIAEFNNIKKKVIFDLEQQVERVRVGNRLSITNPWKETNATAVRMMKDVGRLHTELSRGLITYDSCRMAVHTNGGRPEGDLYARSPDKMRFELRIRTMDEPLNSFSIGLIRQSMDTEFLNETASCSVVGPDGTKPRFQKIAMKTETGEIGDREVCLFFTPPLPPHSGPYTIYFEEDGTDLMAELFLHHKDVIGYEPQRTNVPVGKMEFILFVHNQVELLFDDANDGIPFKIMEPEEINLAEKIFPHTHAYGIARHNVVGCWVCNVHKIG